MIRGYGCTMTTFMLHGWRVSLKGRVCAPRSVVMAGAQTAPPAFAGLDWS